MKCTNNIIGSDYFHAHFNKIFKYRPYYAGIILDAFGLIGHLLCFKLCRHNWLGAYCSVHFI